MDRLRAILLTLLVAALALLYRAQVSGLNPASGRPPQAPAPADLPVEGNPPAAREPAATGVLAGSSSPATAPASPAPRKRAAKSAEDYYLQVLARVSHAPGVAGMAPPSLASRINRDYADLFKYLQLDPAAAQALVDLLQRKQQTRWWMYGRRFPGGGNMTLHDSLLKAAEDRKKIDAEIAALLGADAYDIYTDYARTLPLRRDLAAFKTKLYGAGADLTWEQEDALLTMMQEEARRAITEEEDAVLAEVSALLPEERDVPESEIYLRRAELMIQRYLASAEGLLTPDQMVLYEQYLRESFSQDQHYVEQSGDWDVASNDKAAVSVGNPDATPPAPVVVQAAAAANNTWGDYHGGSKVEVYETATQTMGIDTDLGTGWGAGVTFWPSSASPNSDGSVNVAGATKVVARINAPAGATLRFGVLESGNAWSGAESFEGVNGADGEAFRHEGVTTEAGWQVYTIPLSELKLNGGYGNQQGNRTIDTQAVKGLELLVPGGQADVTMEVDYVRIE